MNLWSLHGCLLELGFPRWMADVYVECFEHEMREAGA